jgi:hypothetical protein
MKNILKKLFGKEEPNNKEITPPSCIPETLYNIGWEINISGSKRVSSEWQRVDEKDIKEVKESLKNQVEEMHKILEEAHTQKKEYVNLYDNVFKLSDVSSVTSYCYKI